MKSVKSKKLKQKTVNIVNLQKAMIGDVVEVTRDDCWNVSGIGLDYLLLVKKTIGLVVDIKKTKIHEHPYLVISTAFGKVAVKKGGW